MRTLRAAGAGLLLVLLVAGVPLALAATVGNPLGSWPDLLAGDVTDRVIIDILAAVAYLAWAQFAVATIVELVSAVRRTPMPRPIPGVFGGQQQLARTLVTAALLLLPTVSSAVTPTVQALAALPHPALAVTQPAAATTGPERTGQVTGWPAYTVTADGPSTFWDLAEATAGTGDRWRDLWQANSGRTQPDGSVLDTSAVVLKPGWTVLVPQLPAGDTAQVPTAGAGDASAAGETVTVRPGDTLSEIAADHGVEHWQRIWPENEGREQPGGDALTDPDRIEPGWSILIPADAREAPERAAGGQVTVTAGDTLSGIAAEHGADLDDVIAANTGRPQPGGGTLADPDLIEPGWTITLPATPVAVPPPADRLPGAEPVETPPISPAPDAADPAPTTPDAAPEPAAPQGSSAGAIILTPSTLAPKQDPAPEPGSIGSARTITTDSSDSVASDTMVAGDTAEGDAAKWPEWAVIAAGGTLLAGSALTVLRRHRRSQMRRRPPGRFIGATPDDVLDTERVLLAAGGDGWDRTQWMDRALRSLVTTRGPGALPDVLALRLADDGLELVLRRPQPEVAAPWVASADGLRWQLDRTEQLTFAEEDRPFHYAPYPALVTVGQSDTGDTWLLDLEAARYLPVTGSLAVAGDFARSMATELATNVWSEIMSVTLCGLGPELNDLDPQRLRVDTDLTAAVSRLRHQAQDVADRAGDLALSDSALVDAVVLDGRRDGTDGDQFAPEVLIVAGSAADSPEVDLAVRRLLDSDRRSACAVVACRGETPGHRGGLAVTVDPDGRLLIPELGLNLRAARASAADSADLAALLDHARTADHRPMPRPAEGHPLHGSTDDAGLVTDLHAARPTGAVVTAGTTDTAVTVYPDLETDTDTDRDTGTGSDSGTDGDTDPVDVRSLLPEPVVDYLAGTAATAEDVTVLAPDIPAEAADRLAAAVTGLDRDLADWHTASTRPKVAVLGPVTVTARGDQPDSHPRRAWNAEMIAYLATREQGATVEELGAAMWPGEPDVAGKSKLRNAVYLARKWLGPNPVTGRDHLPSQKGAQGATYRLEDVLLDADLFIRLRVRAQARGGRDGIRDLRAALDLVTGPPFDQRRPGGYSWLAGTPLDYQYQAMIVDVAHTVATHHLAAGEPAQAEWAARVALLAGSQEDTPLLDLVAACRQQGDTAAADQHVRAIMANHDAEIEEDLPTRTYEILLRKDWLPTSATAARTAG